MSDVQSLLVADYITKNSAPGSRPLEPGASIDRKTVIHTNDDIIAYAKMCPGVAVTPGLDPTLQEDNLQKDYSMGEVGNDGKTSSDIRKSKHR